MNSLLHKFYDYFKFTTFILTSGCCAVDVIFTWYNPHVLKNYTSCITSTLKSECYAVDFGLSKD